MRVFRMRARLLTLPTVVGQAFQPDTALWLLLSGLTLIGGAACSSSPRAPALEDSSVYTSETEGFRFLVPEGWFQQSRAVVPSGPAPQEQLMVTYRCFDSAPPAGLEVALIDLPENADLGRYLEEHPWSGQSWRVVGPPQTIQSGVLQGQRFFLEPASGPLVREVAALRRGGRVYFFNGSFGPKDTTRRDQVRQVVLGLRWK